MGNGTGPASSSRLSVAVEILPPEEGGEALLIIFDTNAVNLLNPEGPNAEIVRKLRQSGHHRVGMPWMVLEEMAAHQARYYPDKHQRVLNTLAKLQEDLPWELKSSLEPLDLERLLDHWRDAYREIFEVIETSDAVLRRAYQREAMALPPAKRVKDHSEGGRDAAIWFSILEFLQENPDEHVYFVHNNTSDFGDGSSYKYPMDEDVRGLEDRLTMLRDFDQVVSKFTREVSGEKAEEAATQVLASSAVRDGVAEAALGLSTLTGYEGLGEGGSAEWWFAWSAAPEVELLAVTDVRGHAIEGDVWYTAKAKWLLYGLAGDGMESVAGYVACVWETKILFSGEDGMGPTLLTSGDPVPPDADDEPCMKLLHTLKKRVTDFAAAAQRKVLAARTPAEQVVSTRLAATLAGLDLSSAERARQIVEQAGLDSGPLQHIARLAAEQQELMNGPLQRVARQMAADQSAMYKAINAPGIRLAQQAAARMAAAMPQLDLKLPPVHIALPKLDVPGYTYQLRSSDSEAHIDAEKEEQQTTSGSDAPENEPEQE
ncbi:PIN domain-containing protein [Streptomyces sp. NPDC059575]|uniref:PIN domain-containing protein n=1 Tax=Streptomyces sp. NPDC059575 TaxID=3346872 RepID=UPI00369D28C9